MCLAATAAGLVFTMAVVWMFDDQHQVPSSSSLWQECHCLLEHTFSASFTSIHLSFGSIVTSVFSDSLS